MMQKNILFLFLLLGITPLLAQNQEFKKSVYFADAQSNLNVSAQQTLDQICEAIASAADYTIEIQAHTDDRGNTAFNQNLAQQRANSVQNYLHTNDIISTNIQATAFGESKPLYQNNDEKGRSLNRRVDIFVNILEKIDYLSVREELRNELLQKFTINPEGKIQIIGKKGTTIWIDEQSFVKADGSFPKGKITVNLTECYDFSEMLLADLSTHSGDRMLETGGMIRIQAFAEGQELQLASDKNLTVGMPNQVYDKQMKLFTGTENSHEVLTDWELSGTPLVDSPIRTLRFAASPPKPRRTKDSFTFTPDSTFMPRLPQKPQKRNFTEPRFPDTTRVVVMTKGIFKSKKKLEEERQKKVDRLVARYERQVARQAADQLEYENKLLRYEKDMAVYPIKKQEWEAEQKKRKAEFFASDSYKRLLEFKEKNYKLAFARWEKEMEAYKRYRAKKAAAFEEEYEKKGSVDFKAVNSYFFTLNTLGWINVDKFSKVKEWDLLAWQEDKKGKEGQVYAIFKDMNSILRIARNQEGQLIEKKLPHGEKVTFVAWKIENGQPLLAKTETVVGQVSVVDLRYKRVHLKELKKAMNL